MIILYHHNSITMILFFKCFYKFKLKTIISTDSTIYLEYESGTNVDGIELKRLMDIVIEGDTIIATEVSRITRSTKQLCEVIEFAKDRKIKLILGNLVVDCTKSVNYISHYPFIYNP